MAILIFGDPLDPHIAQVQQKIKDLGQTFHTFNIYQLENELTLKFSSSGTEGKVYFGDTAFEIDEIKSIWWRIKRPISPPPEGSKESLALTFASQEWRFALLSLPMMFDKPKWINHPQNQTRTANKPHQLFLAQKVGLRITDTVISNHPGSVTELFSKSPRTIYKTLDNFTFPNDEYIFTTEISQEFIESNPKRIQRAPGIYQTLVEKDHELRVTVVGDRLFAVKIDSQKNEKTAIDWRKSQGEDMYEAIELDEKFSAKILKFHKLAGIHYGAYDFIVPKEGEPVFLECNPAGQWFWLEKRAGIPVSEALAQDLAD